MKTTLDLFNQVKQDKSDYALAELMGVHRTTLVMARKNRRLSPELAAKFAAEAGENVMEWIAIAAAEQLPEPKRSWLMEQITGVFILGVVTLAGLATPFQVDAEPITDRAAHFVLCELAQALLSYAKRLRQQLVARFTTRSDDHILDTSAWCPTS